MTKKDKPKVNKPKPKPTKKGYEPKLKIVKPINDSLHEIDINNGWFL